MDQNRNLPRRPCRLCDTDNFKPVYYLDGLEVARCQQCGLIQVASPLELPELKGYYARLGTGLATEVSRPWSAFAEGRLLRASRFRLGYIQKHTGLRAGMVLEVGSAQGHFLGLLQARGFQVLGVEPAAYGAGQHRARGIPVINAMLEDVALPDNQFDVICLFQVFEHFEDPKAAARIFHAKLKQGGYLVIEVPDIHSTGAKFEKSPQKLFKSEHLSYFSPESLETLLAGAGFAKVAAHHCDYDGWRISFGRSLKKILVPIFRAQSRGLLEKILDREIDIHYHPGLAEVGSASNPRKSRWPGAKTLRKTLTGPLDILCGYLAHRLDRGASLYWIGRKQ